jgi:C-terminal processing protease CtpA/Prc
MTDLIQNGRVINRPWIGISYVKITRQLAQYYRLPTTEGMLIAQIESQSPADDAGLRKGDIIEAVDGKRIVGLVILILSPKCARIIAQTNHALVWWVRINTNQPLIQQDMPLHGNSHN